LDAFLVLLGLAASYPQSIILLREAPAGDAGAELPVTETTEGAESAELPVLTKQSLQRQWSRALAVTIGATIRGFPLALLLNSRRGWYVMVLHPFSQLCFDLIEEVIARDGMRWQESYKPRWYLVVLQDYARHFVSFVFLVG